MRAQRKSFLCFTVIMLFSGILCGQEVQYRFSKDKPLTYGFSVRGDVSYQYEGVPGQDFKVLSRGEMTLETLEERGDVFRLKLTPSKTLIKLNEAVLEDITAQETAVSQLISTALMNVRRNGKIISTEEIVPGILNISQILMMMPAFPEKLSAMPWTQTVPAFSLPGVPMCALKFTYQYVKGKAGPSKIRLLSNQRIKEKRRDGEVDVQFTGMNSSKGEFLFDEAGGEIRSFEGVIDLVMSTVFKMPPGPEQETTTKQTLPLTMRIKLNVNLSPAGR